MKSFGLRIMRSLLCIMLALALIMPAQAFAAENEKKVVRVGWFTSDLFQEGSKDDEPKSGYAYDYLRKLADYTSWEYEYVYGEWSELYDKLCDGEIDIMAGMSKTDEREEFMLFPSEAMETDKYYLYKRIDDASISVSDLSSFDGKKIGLLHNNRISEFAEEWVEDNDIDAEIVYFDSFDELDEAFNKGEIDLEPRTMDGASDHAGISAAVRLGEESSYLAVSKQRKDLLKELNEAISSMNVVDPYLLQELEYNNYGTVYTERAITTDEQVWLEEHPVIKVGYVDGYLPYCSTAKDGTATGLLTDVLNAVFEALETDTVPTIEYVECANYQAIVDALNSGEIDIGFPVSDDTWRLEQDGISASADVVSDRGVLFYTSVCEKEDVKKIAVKKGGVFQEEYTKITYPNAEIVYYSSVDACLQAVAKGEVDGTIMDALRVEYVTGQSKYENLSYVQLSDVTGKCFGIDQGNKDLLMLLNRGLKLIGTSYGYDSSYKYMDSFHSYTIHDFLKEYQGEISFALFCIALFFFAVLALYIRKQQQEIAEKEALRRKADEANAAKSMFLFNMSHDIRTPMNAVLGFNELMLKDIDKPDKLREYIEKIRFSGEYLLGLINNVLEVARIDSGRETLDEEFADLRDETYYIVFENQVREKQLNVIKNVDVVHRYVYTDANKIREILLNLISNAVKYTPAGGTIRINLSELPSDEAGYATYVCDVSDTGIGMTEEFQKHVFETFARAQNSTESKIMGTGLGMAIVKKLVDLMGGTVTVQSEPGVGTTFTVTMKLRIVDNPEEYLKKQEKAEAESEGEFSLEGKHILLAEDNELNAEIATAILENFGAIIDVARDGVECIDMLQSHEAGCYDLILMDIQMPRLDGYGAARKIRELADPAKAGIPIIAMTANAFDEDKKAAFEAGMNGHVAKPIDVNALIETVEKLLG